MFKYPVNIIQVVESWLPKTMVWMYEQINNIPEPYVSNVISSEIINRELFPLESIFFTGHWPIVTRLKKKLDGWTGLMPEDPRSIYYAKSIKAKLIHSHFGNVAWYHRKLASSLDVPHIISFYGFDVLSVIKNNNKWEDRYRELFRNSSSVLVMGPVMRDSIMDIGCNPDKIKIHHLGVDLNKLPFKPRVIDKNRPIRFLISGSFLEKKGIPVAIEALAKIKKNYRVELTIVGDSTGSAVSEEEKQKIFAAIEHHNMKDEVSLVGYKTYRELLEIGYAHDVFLAPSLESKDGDKEGIPTTIIEMMASGMPVISTYHSDIPEVVRNEETGWLCKEGSVNELIHEIEKVLNNADDVKSVIAQARGFIEEEFDAKKQGNKLAKIYNQCLK